MPRHVVILGAGISGLSCAWHLKKQYKNDIHITLLEKSGRVGGLIRTVHSNGFLFEQGPHSCRGDGGEATLQLLEELGLQDQIIYANPESNARYVYHNNML